MSHVSPNPFLHFLHSVSNEENVFTRHWGWLLILGIFMILLGLIAIGTPWVGALAIDFLVGWLLVVGGLAHLIDSVQSRKWSGFFLELLTGALYLVIGIVLLMHPLRGILTLTMLLGIFFMIEGVFKIVLAIELRKIWSWGWMLMNGILALILGGLIWNQWPSSSAWAIGLLVGIDLLFGGWTMIILSLAARPPTPQPEAKPQE
jgi:uncharacterized membrane protein HdeD (DUF308 family)